MTKPVYFVKKLVRAKRGGFRVVIGSNLKTPPYPNRQRVRGEVREFSADSRARLNWVATQADVEWKSMITLTYAKHYPKKFKDFKADLNYFLVAMRRRLVPVKYLWFMEFQSRGAVHFHILLTKPPVRAHWEYLSPKWCGCVIGWGGKAEWARWFNSFNRGKFWIEADKPGGLARYASKYALKIDQKKLPDSITGAGRFWGCSRGLVSEEVIYSGNGEVDDIDAVYDHISSNLDSAPDYVRKLRYIT